MKEKKTLLIRIDIDLYNDIHKVMGYALVSSDNDIVIERMHYGSHQDFYRKLLNLGLGTLKKEWENKKAKIESQDDN